MRSFFKIVVLVYMSSNFLGISSTDVDVPRKVNVVENNISMSKDDDDEFEDFEDFKDEVEIKEVYDPFESYNRSITGFNDSLYINILKPMDVAYRVVTTQNIRNSIGNFFNNLYFPMHFINNVLQGKINATLIETGRFLVNSTVGILGVFDPAKSKLGLYPHKEDFGQTLGYYGVGAGPHIVLPFFGPSNLRDIISMIPDAAVSPIDYTERAWWTITDQYWSFLTIKAIEKFNNVSLYSIQYDQIRKDAVDLYPYLREIYEQKREDDIRK